MGLTQEQKILSRTSGRSCSILGTLMMPGDVFPFCKTRSRSRRSLSGYFAGHRSSCRSHPHHFGWFPLLLDVRAVGDKSPLQVLLDKPVKPTLAKRLCDIVSPFIAPSTAIISVSTTERECMFLKLVSQNTLQAINHHGPRERATSHFRRCSTEHARSGPVEW